MNSTRNALDRAPCVPGWPPAWLREDDILPATPAPKNRGGISGPTEVDKHDAGALRESILAHVRECRESIPTIPTTAGGTPFVLVTDAAGLETVRAALEETAVVGIDCETSGLDPRCDRVRLLSLSTDTIDGESLVYVVDVAAVNPSPLWGTLAERPIVAHNAVFDLQFLAGLGFAPVAAHCTMEMSRLLHGTRRPKGFHGLQQTAERELGRLLDKTEQRSDWSADLTPEQLAYAAADAAVLPPLFADLTAKLKAAGLSRVADIEARCLPAVAWLCRSGVALDCSAWAVLAAEAKQQAEALAAKLAEAAPPREGSLLGSDAWNWDSPDQVREVFKAVGVTLDSTDDDALAAVDHPMAGLVREYRSAGKLASTYGDGWHKGALHAGRVYAAWKQIGADSGRMSCTKPNCQNLPRDSRYRRCFVAPPGRVLVKADYSQIELRIAAKLTGDKAMLDAYGRGEDLHTQTARMVLGVKEVTKPQRQLAKAVNFGLLYGQGAKGFRVYARSNYGVELSEGEAVRYRNAFFAAYPGLRKWHRSIIDGPVGTRTLAGRRRAGVTRFTEKLNTPVQGTGADGLKQALALLWERRGECPDAFPVLVVHDEIVVEADAAQADAASAWLKDAMIDGMAPLIAPVPVEVEVTVGRTWAGD